MTRRRGPTKKERLASAGRLLEGLLRSPKTRPGLIAAVASHGVTRHFIYGWLTEQIRTAKVTVLKTAEAPLYQMTEFVVIERPRQSDFPRWLDPAAIPNCTHRHVYIDAKLVQHNEIKGAQ